jgi:hypothetical protein
MAQTERDQVIIRSLLADNVSGNVSPEDLRDALASMMGYASLLLTPAGSPAVMSAVGTSFVLVDIFDTVAVQSSDVNVLGSNADLAPDFRLVANSEGIYKADFFASISSSQNNRLVTFRPHINDLVALTDVDQFMSNGSDIQIISFSAMGSFDPGDELDMRILIDTGTSNITFTAAALSMHRVG